MLAAIDPDVIAGDATLIDAHSRFQSIADEFDGESAGAHAYRNLSAIAGMMLDGADWDRPYSPLMSLGGKRTALPDDLDDEALGFFRLLLDEVPSSGLAARMCDILFVRETERASRYALAKRHTDIVAELSLLPDPDDESIQTWIRAAEIAGRYRLDDGVQALTARALEGFRGGTPTVAWHVAQAMRRARYFGGHSTEIAERLNALASAEPNAHAKVQLLEESIRWRRGSDAEERAAPSREAIGDAWWQEAKQRKDSSLVARNFLGNAYSAYRAVPRHLRSERTRKRVGKLPRLIRVAGESALGEMQKVRGGPIDLSPIVEQAEAIANDTDVIRGLARWFSAAPLQTFEDALQSADQSGLLSLVTTSTITDDARKVHSTDEDRLRSGVDPSRWARMVKNYSLHITAIATGHIRPALMQFSTNYRLDIRDFEVIVSASGFVPADRKSLYARGLHHGYYGRVTESLFILAPTIEACVRSALQASAVETRNVKTNDTEIEPGLSALLELPEADEVLGVDLAWNIRALFCGPTGPNLRNRVAHGLLGEAESCGDAALYAWWLAFLLAFTPYYHALRSEQGGPEHAPGAAGSAHASGVSE
ncbi:hypothetical protein HMPREF1529_00914 [Microbacterium sp. oral taxon 186 str. F0373]|nr:hypothetical protein HMPREF1529_00914 [Microbacterium sp. oral taxon 186 str. F0373]